MTRKRTAQLSDAKVSTFDQSFALPEYPMALRESKSKQGEGPVKRISILCLISFVALQIMSAAQLRAQTTAGTEKAVAALEEQWLQSQKTNNPDLVAPLLAE